MFLCKLSTIPHRLLLLLPEEIDFILTNSAHVFYNKEAVQLVGEGGAFMVDFTNVVQVVTQTLTTLFTSIANIFYTPGTDGYPGQLTFVGWMCVFVLIISLALLLLNWIRGLISRR